MFITLIHQSQGEWGGGGVLIIQFIRFGKILNYQRPSIWDLVHNSVRQFREFRTQIFKLLDEGIISLYFWGWGGGGRDVFLTHRYAYKLPD